MRNECPNLAIVGPSRTKTCLFTVDHHRHKNTNVKSTSTEIPLLTVSAQNGRRVKHRNHHLNERNFLPKVRFREQPIKLGLGGNLVRFGHGLLIA